MSLEKQLTEEEYNKIPLSFSAQYDRDYDKTKDRYRNILPYKDTKITVTVPVTLDTKVTVGKSGYINANYIYGFNDSLKSYIATQCPLLGTVKDFWQMVWEQDSRVIVMLTDLKEKNTIKCHQYWPTHPETKVFKDMRIHYNSRRVYKNFKHNQFTLQYNGENRTIHHFWYTSWPDKDVPEETESLLKMRQKIIEVSPDPTKNPWVVHCSAGVGRTGSFIGTDMGIRLLETENPVSIKDLIKHMRKHRMMMVQTYEQSEYIYNALIAYIKFNLDQKIGRILAEEKLSDNGPGSFIIRLGSKGIAVLSIMMKSKVYHFSFEKYEELYKILYEMVLNGEFTSTRLDETVKLGYCINEKGTLSKLAQSIVSPYFKSASNSPKPESNPNNETQTHDYPSDKISNNNLKNTINRLLRNTFNIGSYAIIKNSESEYILIVKLEMESVDIYNINYSSELGGFNIDLDGHRRNFEKTLGALIQYINESKAINLTSNIEVLSGGSRKSRKSSKKASRKASKKPSRKASKKPSKKASRKASRKLSKKASRKPKRKSRKSKK